MKWGFVRTNVRIRWNLIYKAFHRICLCGNKPIVRSSFKRDLDAANLRPLLEQGCGKHAPSASIYFSLRIWYIFWILICRRKVDLGVCVTSVLAKRMRLRNADFRRILQPNTFLNQKSALCRNIRLTCKRGSVGQSEGLSIPRSSVRFRLKPDTSHSHEFELHRPSNKGTKLLLKVIKAIIIIMANLDGPLHTRFQIVNAEDQQLKWQSCWLC